MLSRRLAAATLAGLALTATQAMVAVAASHKAPASQVRAVAAVSNGAWTVYHHDDAHTGYDSTALPAAGAAAGWTSPGLSGQIYGEPLVYNGLVYVATLQNVVYALNQSDGTVAWSKTLPAPETSGWACGNINPTGTLGTGVIDTAANRIYYAPFVHQTGTYWLYAFDLTTGAIVMTTELGPTGFDWTIQQQRGALALSLDRSHVYVPFGGRAGDCGPYHGWVVGVPTNATAPDELYKTVSTGEGIWAAGGVVVDDSTGNVIFATGNAIPCGPAVESDSVIRTNSTLGAPQKFQPPDWQAHWCATDTDLGSVAPTLISPSLIFETGKYGQGFLVNSSTLGQVYPSPSPYVGVDVCHGTNSDASFGAEAYANGRLYLTCDGNGIVSLTVNTSTQSFSSCDSSCADAGTWNAAVGTVGPPIVAGGAVWAVSTSGAGLYGFDATTGTQIYHSAAFGANRFSTPSEAGGQIFVGAGTVVRSFNMVTGCSSVTLSAAPPSSATTGSTVVLTGAASGPNCASPQYQWWMRPAAGTWTMLQDYGASSTYNWTSTTPAGSYYLGVHARALGSSAPFESLASIPYTLTAQTCASVTATAAPTSVSSGTHATLTAVASGCPNPRYEFWLRPASSVVWQMVQAYGISNTYDWNSTGAAAGVVYLGVHARDTGSTASADAYASAPVTVMTSSCASVTVSPAPTTVVQSTSGGTHVIATAAATGCTTSPRYEFWIRPASSGVWQMVQAYGSGNTYDWNSTGAAAGIVYIGVHAKDAGSTASADAYASTPVTVTTAQCTGASVSAAPTTVVHSTSNGTHVTVTATASGCTTSPRYEFWIRPAGSTTWYLVQGYGTSNTYDWNSTGAGVGTVYLGVHVRDANSTASADAYASTPVTVT